MMLHLLDSWCFRLSKPGTRDKPEEALRLQALCKRQRTWHELTWRQRDRAIGVRRSQLQYC